MKRILIVCLLGMGLLLPSANITAKEFFTKRIIDVWTDADALEVSSDANTGGILLVKIFEGPDLVMHQSFSGGYYYKMDVSSLGAGTYTARVFTNLTVYNEAFVLN
jgi:hypothetical protein